MKLCTALAFTLFAFAGCGERGRARASDSELVGSYLIEFPDVAFRTTEQQTVAVKSKEQLTLYPDRTYAQTFSSATQTFTNHGTWISSDELLGGTELQLAGAALFDGDRRASEPRRGDLSLQVHRERGTLKLARNESADWYYRRIP